MIRTLIGPAVGVAFLLAATAAVARGQAGPPLITDDPGTPGDGRWEVNLAFTAEAARRGSQYELPLLDVNYGWGERAQLKFELPLLVVDERDAGPQGGLGDSLLGLKYRFLDEDWAAVSASVYPQVSINNPTRSVQRGLVESGTNVLLPLQVGRAFGRFEVGLEVGYQFVQHDRDEWVYGLAVGYAVTDKIELLAEVYGAADQDFRDDELVANVGCRWAFDDDATLLFAIGRGLYDRPDSPELLLYAGLQFNF